MVSRVVALVFLALSAQALGELDLTPLVREGEQEGIKESFTAFRNGSSYVTWHPPHGWRISGTGNTAVLTPPNATQAEARVEITGPPSADAFDEMFAKKLKDEIIATLPREATKLEWEGEEPGALFINGHPAFRTTYSYTFAGQRFTATLWVCNFVKQQMRFRITARTIDNARIQELFRQSLYTWQGLE